MTKLVPCDKRLTLHCLRHFNNTIIIIIKVNTERAVGRPVFHNKSLQLVRNEYSSRMFSTGRYELQVFRILMVHLLFADTVWFYYISTEWQCFNTRISVLQNFHENRSFSYIEYCKYIWNIPTVLLGLQHIFYQKCALKYLGYEPSILQRGPVQISESIVTAQYSTGQN